MTNVNGVGSLIQRDPVTNLINVVAACTFSFDEETAQKMIESYPLVGCGLKGDIEVVEEKTSMKVTVATKSIDDESFSWMMMNARSQVSPSIILPDIRNVTVPANGEIAIASLVADQKVSVVILGAGANEGKLPLSQVASATAVTADTHRVTAGKIEVLASAYAGMQAVVWIPTTYSAKKIWGGNMPVSRFRNIEIHGQICGTLLTGKKFLFPKCTSTKGASFASGQDENSREFTALIDYDRGFTSPYASW